MPDTNNDNNTDDKTVTHVLLTEGLDVLHYRIVERIGAGGMGEVFLADDTKLNRRVALKFMPTHLASQSEMRLRFTREAQAAAKLDHPNIVPVYEVGEFAGRPFFAMAHIEGKSLHDVIKLNNLSIDENISLITQVCEGLQKAHESGVVHRDIKPGNIMIDSSNRARLLDFGLATVYGEDKLTKVGSTVGTTRYMSPEQAEGKEVDHRSDLFSLGIALYELVAGRTPFERENAPATLRAITEDNPEPLTRYKTDVSKELQRVIDKALAKDKELRYQSASDMKSDLKRLSAVGKKSESELPSIAVLPFSNMSADVEQEYFCDGIAEDILNDLAQVDNLRVVSRTSSFAFKGKTEDLRDVGRKLNAGTILEGSVRKAGNRLRITAQLINVANGYHMWSERYDRELDDVFAIQDEIAGNIVRALRIKLNPKFEAEKVNAPTDNMEAYELYLRGRAFFHRAGQKQTRFAIELFSRAIEKDPGYAQAYAGLADSYSNVFLYFDNDRSNVDSAMEASKKALELNPQLAEAHASRGLAVSLGGQYQEAEKEFEKAIELNPNLFEAYYHYARACFVQGKHEMACKLYEQAGSVKPDDYQAPILAANSYEQLNRPDKMRETLKRGLEIIERRLELNPDDVRGVYLGSIALIAMGEKEKGTDWMEQAIAMEPDDPAVLYNSACMFSKLEQPDKVFQLLNKAIDCGFSHKEWIENDEDLANMRSHKEYQSILDRLSD